MKTRFDLIDLRASRDAEWLRAGGLVRRAVKTLGRRCLACGGSLWSRAGTNALYCDDVCRRRHHRRRERLRGELRRREAACPLCGCHP